MSHPVTDFCSEKTFWKAFRSTPLIRSTRGETEAGGGKGLRQGHTAWEWGWWDPDSALTPGASFGGAGSSEAPSLHLAGPTFKIRKGTEREKGFWSVRIRQIQAQKDGERNEWRQLICVTSFNFPQILLEQWLSTRVNLTLQGTFGSVWRCFSWSQLRREGCYCHFMDRGQDAANHPMKLKTVPITKNYLTLNATVPGLRNPAGRRAFLYTSPCNSRESSGSEGLPTA